MKIPHSRVVNVSLNRNTRFVTQRGFGTGLILSALAVAGILDASNRTKVYGSIEEIAADHATTTSVYKQANTFFAQDPSPLRIKVGFADVTPATATKEELQTELNAIYDVDQDFYSVLVGAEFRDTACLDGLVEWIETKSKIAMIDSNDVLHEDSTDTTNISARHKGQVERTATFYHTDAEEYLAAGAWAYMATRNLDQANSNYTVKFKKANLVSAVNIGIAALTAVTGFIEEIGQSETAGHCSNTYIDIGNQDFITNGSMLSQNIFLDEIHASDYIIARTEEKTLSLFLNNDAIDFTDQGMQQIASVPRAVMQQGVRSGIVAKDLNPSTGAYEPAYTITVPSVFDVPESQRKARVSPKIEVRFRYAGAVHYTTIIYTMTF